MDFSFTDEQQQLRRSVREFAESEIAPHVMEWDEASQFPCELIPKLAEMGLMGVIFPEDCGGEARQDAGDGREPAVAGRARSSDWRAPDGRGRHARLLRAAEEVAR